MKQCSKCEVTMFDGSMMCGVCGCEDLIQISIPTPSRQVLVHKKKPTKAKEEARFSSSSDITRISATVFEVRSKTNSRKSYIINLNKMRDHKGDCLGYRYSQNCNHLVRLREAGVDV